MRKIEFPTHNTDVWLSDDQLEEFQSLGEKFQEVVEEWKDTVEEHLTSLLGVLDNYEEEYVRLYLRSIDTPHIACLMAHGGVDRKEWLYTDGERTRRVQSWIDRREKDYGLLILCCCNDAGLTPKSRRALLLVPDSTFSIAKVEAGSSNFSLVHPTKGELEHIIEHELSELRKSAKGAT